MYKFVCDPEALFQMAGPSDRLKVEQEQANQVEGNITSRHLGIIEVENRQQSGKQIIKSHSLTQERQGSGSQYCEMLSQVPPRHTCLSSKEIV